MYVNTYNIALLVYKITNQGIYGCHSVLIELAKSHLLVVIALR